MARKCCAPFCSVDNTAGIFELFGFPCKEEVRGQWLARLMLPCTETLPGGPEIYLCEVHFDDNSWNERHGKKRLLESAIPSIFQHYSPVEYINRVYEKLNSLQLINEEGNRVLVVLDKIKADGVSEDVQVKHELIQCGTLLVTSTLQMLQLKLTSDLILCNESENEVLSTQIEELQHTLKSTK